MNIPSPEKRGQTALYRKGHQCYLYFCNDMHHMDNRPLYLILGVFLTLGFLHCVTTPLWFPPDEDRHFAYCEYIANNKTLPHLDVSEKGFHISQAIHPPLYYLIGQFFCKKDSSILQTQLIINDGPGYNIVSPPPDPGLSYTQKAQSAYLLRVVSLLFSAVTVCLTYLILLVIFPGCVAMASAGALFVATNPEFLHISASVSNEPLSTTLSSLYLLLLALQFNRPATLGRQVAAGCVLGCCLLTKSSTIIYIPVTLFFLWLLHQGSIKKALSGFCLIMTAAMAVAGWWYLHNLIKYHDPVFAKSIVAMQPWAVRNVPFSWGYALSLAKITFISFFGCFGSMQIPLAAFQLGLYGSMVSLACFGLVKTAVRKKPADIQTKNMLVMAAAIVCGLLLYMQFNMQYSMFMGRYFFVFIVPLAICFSCGFKMLFPRRWQAPLLVVASCLLVAVSVDVFFRTLQPACIEPSLAEGCMQKSFSHPTPAISGSTTIGEVFTAPRDGLCAIRVMFASETETRHGNLHFTLREADTNHLICRIATPLADIEFSSKYFFVFPPVPDSIGKKYLFSFAAPSTSHDQGISLWYDPSSSDNMSSLRINDAPRPGNLYFATYHFTGDHPTSVWEGIRPAAINQGWYISMRELQYYGEIAYDLKKTLLTNNKIIIFENACKNIESNQLSPPKP